MDTFLEWKIVVGRRRFTSGHRTVGGEEEDRNNYGGTKWRTSWKAETWKKIWQKIDIFGVCEWMDGSWLLFCPSWSCTIICSINWFTSLCKNLFNLLEYPSKLNKFLHSEVNQLIQHKQSLLLWGAWELYVMNYHICSFTLTALWLQWVVFACALNMVTFCFWFTVVLQ